MHMRFYIVLIAMVLLMGFIGDAFNRGNHCVPGGVTKYNLNAC